MEAEFRTNLVVEAQSEDGKHLPVNVGIYRCRDGKLRFGIRIADEVAVLTADQEIELSVKVRQTIAERLKATGEL